MAALSLLWDLSVSHEGVGEGQKEGSTEGLLLRGLREVCEVPAVPPSVSTGGRRGRRWEEPEERGPVSLVAVTFGLCPALSNGS